MLALLRPRVSSRVSGFPVASPCLWGKLQNSFSKVSKQVVMSVCVAGAILLRRFHRRSCSFRGSRSIYMISVVILRGRRSTSDVSHCVLYTLHSTLHPLHFTFPLHSALYTLHSTLHTLHSTLYTLHTLHSTLYTLDCTLHAPHFTL